MPFWAIFELSFDQTTGDWHFLTQQGDLSHFALFGRVVLDPTQQCANPPCNTVQEVTRTSEYVADGCGAGGGREDSEPQEEAVS